MGLARDLSEALPLRAGEVDQLELGEDHVVRVSAPFDLLKSEGEQGV